MEKLYAIIEVLKLIKALVTDTDGDGTMDIFDREPENPEVK